jgi:hypothetical protein
MKYAVEMSSSVTICIPKVDMREDTQTAWRSHKPNFIFENKKNRLKCFYLMMIYMVEIRCTSDIYKRVTM